MFKEVDHCILSVAVFLVNSSFESSCPLLSFRRPFNPLGWFRWHAAAQSFDAVQHALHVTNFRHAKFLIREWRMQTPLWEKVHFVDVKIRKSREWKHYSILSKLAGRLSYQEFKWLCIRLHDINTKCHSKMTPGVCRSEDLVLCWMNISFWYWCSWPGSTCTVFVPQARNASSVPLWTWDEKKVSTPCKLDKKSRSHDYTDRSSHRYALYM